MRSLRPDAAAHAAAPAPELVVRPACRYADTAALERLAARTGERVLAGGHVLVAEWAGRVVAAVSMHDGRVVADPSARALDAVATLRRHASAQRPARARVALPWMPRMATRRLAATTA